MSWEVLVAGVVGYLLAVVLAAAARWWVVPRWPRAQGRRKMTVSELVTMFEAAERAGNEESAATARHPHREAAALLVLAELDPTPRREGFSYSNGSRLYFTADPVEVAARVTPESIRELVAAGVHYDASEEAFYLSV